MKPSNIFVKCLKYADKTHLYGLPQIPTHSINSDVQNAESFLQENIERWLIDNQNFIIKFLKAKAQEEKDKAQKQFDFVKDL